MLRAEGVEGPDREVDRVGSCALPELLDLMDGRQALLVGPSNGAGGLAAFYLVVDAALLASANRYNQVANSEAT